MFSKFLSAAAAGVAVLALLSGCTLGEKSATAIFSDSNNGVMGWVNVTDGAIWIALDLSTWADDGFQSISDGANCTADGLKFHIHELWEHTTSDDQIGSTMCGAAYTGGHWDPWAACGSATGNTDCFVKGGCINGSSVLSNDGGYDCSESNFLDNPYSCEVGDWNGKYGVVEFDGNYTGWLTGSSAFEVSGADVINKSVVFHCSTDGAPRAFCAQFVEGQTDSSTRPTQEDDDVTDMSATIGDSIFVLMADGSVDLDIDVSSLTIPSNCGDDLYYRIYNDWSASDMVYSTNSTMCNNYVGSFYDPTVTCASGSDSAFCQGDDSTVCGDNSTYSCDWSTSPFLCAPGDLSGKYGSLDISGSDTDWSIDTDDYLMIDLTLLDGMSVVLQCADTWEIIGCGKWREYNRTRDDSSSSDDNNGNGGNSSDSNSMDEDDDDSAFELSVTFGSLMVVLSTIAQMFF